MRAIKPSLHRARRARPAAVVTAQPVRQTSAPSPSEPVPASVAGAATVPAGATSAGATSTDAFLAAAATGPTASIDADMSARRAEHAFRVALDETVALARQGIEPVWMFDLDNTLYDTRARTLAIGKAFDAANGTSYFLGIETSEMSRVKRDAAQTAEELHMLPDHATAFAAVWDRQFWLPENVRFDVEIPEMFDRLQRVLDAGGVPLFVTGRAEEWVDELDKTTRRSFREPTLARLRRSWQEHPRMGSRVDITDAMLVLKPTPARNTRAFKAGVVELEQREPIRASRRIAMRQKHSSRPQQRARVLVASVTDTLAELTEFGRVNRLRAFWVRTAPEAHLTGHRPGWVQAFAPVF